MKKERQIEKIYSLTPMQEGMLFHALRDTEANYYCEQYLFTIVGNIDKDLLEESFNFLISRHDILHTLFVHDKIIKPKQVVVNGLSLEIKVEDISFLSMDQQDKYLEDFKVKDRIRGFDLSRDLLMRVFLFCVGPNIFKLLWSSHHIIMDGWSSSVFVSELIQVYQALKRGETVRLVPPVPFRNYIKWLEKQDVNEGLNYWERYLHGYEHPVTLPKCNRSKSEEKHETAEYRFSFDKTLSAALIRMAGEHQVTVNSVCQTMWGILLQRYNNTVDVVFGTVVSGRPPEIDGIEHMIGLLINAVPVRITSRPGQSFVTLLTDVGAKAVASKPYEYLPLADIQNLCVLKRDLIGHLFTFENYPVEEKMKEVGNARELGFEIRDIQLSDPINYDFAILFFPGEMLTVAVTYNPAVYPLDLMRTIEGHFRQLVNQVIADPSIHIGNIDILNRPERKKLLFDFNTTETGYPRHKTIHELFESQAERLPDSIAAVDTDGYHLTYRVLNREANRLANYLYNEKQVGPDEPVAILLERGLNYVSAVLGVLKSGGAYVPIDTALPLRRIRHIINDAAIRTIISGKNQINLLNRLQWECPSFHSYLCLDSWDIHAEKELEKNELMDKKLWEYMGEKATNEIEGGGWSSSFTGETFTKAEMDEYGDNILKKLTPLLHKQMRVLEIGCASGISLFRIAPRVGFYYATDLSDVIIRKNRLRAEEDGHHNIVFQCLPAHEIQLVKETDFDLVIINSVIQAFHGHNYLRQVIEKTIALLRDSGYLFIGDVMDQDLKEQMIREMWEFKQSNRGKGYRTKTDFSSELFVSRHFFEDLQVENSSICEIAFSQKIHTIENELTKFRYDVLISIDKTFGRVLNKGVKHKFQDDMNLLTKYNAEPLPNHVKPESPAYVIYTSGTTGKPKGVMVEHRGVVNYLVWAEKMYLHGEKYDFPLYSSLSFDLTVTSLYLPLISGNKIVVYKEDSAAPLLSRIVRENRVGIIKLTPTHLNMMLEFDLSGSIIDKMIVGGEELTTTLAAEILKMFNGKIDIFNEYGPTETVVGSTIYKFDPKTDTQYAVPIGIPVDNTQIYILDRELNPVPMGVPGEVFISGAGVARGYLSNPELTAEKFIANPFIPGSRMYRSGDLAKWMADGTIDFLGRIDLQVKIRGFRIETGEIEQRLQTIADFKETVVMAREDQSGGRYLCAYILSSGPFNASEVKAYLSEFLPNYMIPTYFIQLDEIPVTPNGKVDRKALPDPEIKKGDEYIAPRTDVEKQMVKIWAEVLGLNEEIIGIDSNFFDMGGHSLKATILISRIHKALNVKIPLSEVFKSPTIREISKYIKGADEEIFITIENTEKKEYYPLSYNQQRLWIIHQLAPCSPSYHMPGSIPLDHVVDVAALEKTLALIFQRHESFRTYFKNVEGSTYQFIEEAVDIPFEYIDISTLPAEERQAKTDALYLEIVRTPFDLSRAPLFRSLLVKSGETSYDFMFNMHHIISDGWSHEVLRKEFVSFYDAFSIGKAVNPAPLKLQYKDFAYWHSRQIGNPRIKEQSHRFWKTQLEGGVPKLQLPVVPGMDKNDRSGAACVGVLDEEILIKLRQIAENNTTTLFTVLFSLCAMLLSRFADREKRQDVICSIINAGRDHEALTDVVGFFVNAVLFKTPVDYEEPFNRFLQRVHTGVLETFQHQAYPLELVCEDLQIRYPDIPVSFNMLNLGDTHNVEKPLGAEPPDIHNVSDIKFDIELYVVEYKNTLDIIWTYRKNMFSPDSIDFLLREYIKLTEFFAINPAEHYKAFKLVKSRQTIWE